AGVKLITNCGVEGVVKKADGSFELTVSESGLASETPTLPRRTLACDKLLLATGGCRTPALGQLAVLLGHTLEAPVPSLFTFHIDAPWLRELAGVSVESAEAAVPSGSLS